jgi:hypothetical protein
MKKLHVFTTLFITSCILFSSCETSSPLSKFSIEKRHYKSGYYIDYRIGAREVTPIIASNTNSRIAEIPTTVYTEQDSIIPSTSLVGSTKSSGMVPATITNVKKVLAKTNLQPIIKQSHSYSAGSLTSSTIENEQVISQSPLISDNTSDGDRGERAALSLLWLVIVIVLILWLIGILAGGFGLGGFINLLLVVALILLILWLLRVI